MRDERNHHGAVDKSFSEQRICIIDVNYIHCEKIGPVRVAELGLMAGRQVAGRQAGRQVAGRWQTKYR